MKRLPFIFALIVWMLFAPAPPTMATDEFQEAIQQTEDEWKAVRTTMQEGKGKFDDFRKKYKEYHDAVFSDSPEQGIALAQKLFNLDQSQTDAANDKLNQLREMFNELDKAGLKEKLEAASKYLDKADKYAGEVQNLWEFTKKFDPEHAKDNPTYGLRLIGKMLTESASKMEKIPLVGQILGKWIKAYGEVAVEFANALDKLAKKIDDFRGGSLCGQLGKRQDQQAAFKAAGGSLTAWFILPQVSFHGCVARHTKAIPITSCMTRPLSEDTSPPKRPRPSTSGTSFFWNVAPLIPTGWPAAPTHSRRRS